MSSSCTAKLNFYRPLNKDNMPMLGIQLTLKKPDNMEGWQQIKMPCNKCPECRKAQAREWAVRCCLEMNMHEQNTFLTLTYDPEHMPKDGGLVKSHLQKFIKRFRKSIAPLQIRFFACGEYGKKLSRPHYHLIIFGYDFPDKERYSINDNGDPLYNSPSLQKLWPFGQCMIGNATSGSCNYVAGYVAKKENGVKAEKHYQHIDLETGEVHQIIPEFLTMSTTPGIGYSFYQQYKTDMFPSDNIHIRTNENIIQCPVPYFFYRKLRDEDPELFLQVQAARIKKGNDYALTHPEESSPERLATKAFVKRKEKLSSVRTLEGEQEKHSVDMTDIHHMQDTMAHFEHSQKNQEVLRALFSKKSEAQIVLTCDIQIDDKIIKIEDF